MQGCFENAHLPPTRQVLARAIQSSQRRALSCTQCPAVRGEQGTRPKRALASGGSLTHIRRQPRKETPRPRFTETNSAQ